MIPLTPWTVIHRTSSRGLWGRPRQWGRWAQQQRYSYRGCSLGLAIQLGLLGVLEHLLGLQAPLNRGGQGREIHAPTFNRGASPFLDLCAGKISFELLEIGWIFALLQNSLRQLVALERGERMERLHFRCQVFPILIQRNLRHGRTLRHL